MQHMKKTKASYESRMEKLINTRCPTCNDSSKMSFRIKCGACNKQFCYTCDKVECIKCQDILCGACVFKVKENLRIAEGYQHKDACFVCNVYQLTRFCKGNMLPGNPELHDKNLDVYVKGGIFCGKCPEPYTNKEQNLIFCCKN